MKILNFGSCNIDFVYSVDHIVVPGETITTYNMELFEGGKGLNQSIAAAKAGADVYHAGCVGKDGEMLEKILVKCGVDISYLKKVDGKSGHAIIQVTTQGENSIFLYPGANMMVSEEYIDSVLEHFDEGDMVLLQNEISNVDYIVKRASEKGMKITLNPAPFDEKIKDIDLSKLSYIILNEVEAMGLTGEEDAKQIIAYMKRNYPELGVVLTLGKKGCVYSDKNVTLSHPAFIVEVVDTTAAGDTFIGYFLSGIAQGKTYAETIKLSCAASALTVSKKGAAPSIPDYKTTIDALKTFTLYGAAKGKQDKAKKVKDVVDKHINENLKGVRLSDVAKKLGYSETYTGELIKKSMGVSFSKIVQNRRCAVAAKLLVETELSIGEIISRIGYENESFFRKNFREMYGRTPYQYRKMMRFGANG